MDLISPIRFVTNRYILKAIESYCPQKDALILDIGCGNGYHEFFIENQVKGSYLGTDINKRYSWHKISENIEGLNINFKEYNAESIDEINGTFNFICAFQSFEHIIDNSKVLSGMFKLLSEDSYILITVPSIYSYLLYGNHGYRRYNIKAIASLASEAKLDVLEINKLGGEFSFILHFILWTIPAIILNLPVWNLYSVLGFSKLILLLEKSALYIDKYLPLFEGGYSVILQKKSL